MIDTCVTLTELWEEAKSINRIHFPTNRLEMIPGNGNESKPEFMFIFINPTSKNHSAHSAWNGPRLPFMGIRAAWRVFHRAGFLNDEIMKSIENEKDWSMGVAEGLFKTICSQSLYFTNIVKWTGEDSALPDRKKISLFLPILRKEIEIVKPKRIVTFGGMPFQALMGMPITIGKYYEQTVAEKKAHPYNLEIGAHKTIVYPCYFPTGRGNPKRATELLQFIRKD